VGDILRGHRTGDMAMALRIASCVAVSAAPLLILLSDRLSGVFGSMPFVLGLLICGVTYVLGFRLAFVTYAMAAWCLSAAALLPAHRLESPLSAGFADASYLTGVVAVVLASSARRK
jgi:hypothetical protein